MMTTPYVPRAKKWLSVFEISKILLVMFLWAICLPLIVAGFGYAAHLTFAAQRAFIAGAALIAAGLLLGRRWRNGIRLWITLVLVGFGATSLAFPGMFHASEFVSPGIATVIANTQPLLAAVLASLVLGEYPDLRGKIGPVLGFFGIMVVAPPQLMGSQAESYLVGIGYILLAALKIAVSTGQVLPHVDPAVGRQLFASKGCAVCHSVDGVGGEDAPMLDANLVDTPMNPFEFAAKMWRGAPAMVAMQEDEVGGQIEFTGAELANIIAFVRAPAEQAKFTKADIPEAISKMMSGMEQMQFTGFRRVAEQKL